MTSRRDDVRAVGCPAAARAMWKRYEVKTAMPLLVRSESENDPPAYARNLRNREPLRADQHGVQSAQGSTELLDS